MALLIACMITACGKSRTETKEPEVATAQTTTESHDTISAYYNAMMTFDDAFGL